MATYLITGGTGSLGTAITSRLLSEGHKVRTYSRNEHRIEALLRAIPKENHSRLSPIMGATEDLSRIRRAIRGVDFVIHAAAQKIIDLAEYNPTPCVVTDIFGTLNVIEACLDSGVCKAVLVSTDKARAPSTLYGASKLCAERLWNAANRYRGSTGGLFSAVAYGNVWGSRGSVIETWAQQAQFGVLKVMDPKMTRFHITLDGAVNFVLRVVDEAEPETIWIPRLPAYRLGDLADAFGTVYKLSRLCEVVGRRVAEKLHEELITENESPTVMYEDDSHFVLTPGRIHQAGGWSFTSASAKTRRLTLSDLIREVEIWATRSS